MTNPHGILFILFLVFLSKFKVNSSAEELKGKKRPLDDDSYTSRTVKRRVCFYSPRALLASDLEASPPKLLSLIKNQLICQSLPTNYQKFVCIFDVAWSATQKEYGDTNFEDLEFTKWSKSETVQSLSFKTHISFIKELLDDSPVGTVTEDSYELIEEYINYVMSRGDVNLRYGNIANNLLSSAVVHLQPELVSLLLNYFSKHSASSSLSIPSLWHRLFSVAIANGFNVSSSNGNERLWFRIFRIYCLHFGSFSKELISSIELDFRSKNVTWSLVHLLKCQSLLAATAAHSSESFLNQFHEIESLSKTDPQYAEIIENMGLWVEMILKADQCIKYPSIETKSKLEAFADTLYSVSISESLPFSLLIPRLFSLNLIHTLQFLLMYSSKARSSIPGKHEQCRLLIPHLRTTKFDFDYIKMVLIVIGFDIRLKDAETHLVPILGSDHPILEGLRFLLTISDSTLEVSALEGIDSTVTMSKLAPKMSNSALEVADQAITIYNSALENSYPTLKVFDPLIPWEIPLVTPTFTFDPESAFLFDAGRIILANHFKIPPLHTRFYAETHEEACFRDLAWFMTVSINKFRPDLGPNYTIRLKL